VNKGTRAFKARKVQPIVEEKKKPKRKQKVDIDLGDSSTESDDPSTPKKDVTFNADGYPKAGRAGSKARPFKSLAKAKAAGYRKGDPVYWEAYGRLRNTMR